MLIKNFQGDSMHETMKKVKDEFGQNAIILNSRVIEEKSGRGGPARKKFEITAGREMPGTRAGQAAPPPATLGRDDKKLLEDVGLVIRRFEKEINYLVHTQKEIRAHLKTPAAAWPLSAYLEMHDFEKDLIARLFEKQGSSGEGQAITAGLLQARLLRLCEQTQPIKLFASGISKVAFVGTPGVGKSSLLAKVASSLVFSRKVKVSLVNLDDYKPHAIKELATYAKLLKVPCLDGSEWEEPPETQDFQVILADTRGVPYGCEEELETLREKLAGFAPDEIHLVMPAYCLWREAIRWLDFFMPLGLTQAAVTFLDQTASFGLPFNLAAHRSLKLSYFSWGRNKVSSLQEADLYSLSTRIFEKAEEFDVHIAP